MIEHQEYANIDLPDCPACLSSNTVEITDDEKVAALALWDIYDFIGRIEIMTQRYQCTNCGYSW